MGGHPGKVVHLKTREGIRDVILLIFNVPCLKVTRVRWQDNYINLGIHDRLEFTMFVHLYGISYSRLRHLKEHYENHRISQYTWPVL